MNILILNWRGPFHPNSGGAERVTLKYAKHWVKSGHNVTWFTSKWWGCKEDADEIEGVKILRKGNQVLGVHVHAFIWYLFKSDRNYDLIVDQFHGIPFYSVLYSRSKKLAFIHEVTKELWKHNHLPKPLNLVPSLSGELVEKLTFKLIYRNTNFLTVSGSTKKDLVQFGIRKSNIAVITNGVDKVKINSTPKKVRPTLLYLGALAGDKGTADLLKVYENLYEKHRNWNYWIAGKGAPDYIETIKKSSYIKYFGFVTEPKKFELFKKATIFINPSVREGWGLTNIEANSQGTPVVGYSVPGLVDSVAHGKTGLLVDKGDTQGLESAIEKLVSDKSLYSRLSNNSIKRARKFNWDSSLKKSLSLIEKVVEK